MTAFLIVGMIGLLLVVVSLLVGDLLDGLIHLDELGGDLFSVSSLAAFMGAFGFGGALGLSIVGNPGLAIVAGLAAGCLATAAAVKLTKALKSGEDEASFKSSSMIGHSGHVITAIPEDGYGEVRLHVGGHVRKLNARAARALPAGEEIWVSSILSPTAVEVTPTSDPQELTQ